jgi:adenosylhomocysteine nucleosidase
MLGSVAGGAMAEEQFIQNTNVARDHSRVQVQAGQIRGNVTIDTSSQTGLRDQLAELRRDLFAARDCSELDLETFAAANEELSKAAEYSIDTSDGRSKLVIALKRLKVLVENVAELGAKIAAIIAAVHNL